MSYVTTRCANCGTVVEEPVETPLKDRPPCPMCESTMRTFDLSVDAPTGVGIHVPGKGIVVKVGVVTERETAMPINVRQGFTHSDARVSVEDLPTEVITEALDVGITLLPPAADDPDGQWLVEVGVSGYHVPLGVGELPDVLLAAAVWLEGLASRWQEKRRGEHE